MFLSNLKIEARREGSPRRVAATVAIDTIHSTDDVEKVLQLLQELFSLESETLNCKIVAEASDFGC